MATRRPGANRRGLRGFGAATAAAAAWTPASDTGAKRWWRGDLGRTMVSTKVSTWTDQIVGATMSQGTDAKRPTVGTLGGQDALSFAGGQLILGSGHASIAQRWLLYVIAQVTGAAANQVVIDDGGGVSNSPAIQYNATWLAFAGGTPINSGDTTRTGVRAHLLDANGASGKYYIDNFTTAKVTGNAGTSATDSLCVGAISLDSLHLTGTVAEVVITATTDVSDYRSYFNDRYGLSIA